MKKIPTFLKKKLIFSPVATFVGRCVGVVALLSPDHQHAVAVVVVKLRREVAVVAG